VLDWLRSRVTTTPGRLVALSVLIVVAAVCFGAIATGAERSRAHAAQAARTQTEQLLHQAATLYTALSDANATATTTFRKGGLEPPSLRAHYLGDLQTALDALARLTREVGNSPDASAAVRTITEQLPLYTGEIEAARANNRQGFPVGAAYLRQASKRLNKKILPEADRLFSGQATRLSNDYATGTSSGALIVLVIAAATALLLLVLTQAYLTRLSHRIFNLPMVLATVVLAGVSIWAVIGMLGEQSALARAQHHGSDSVEVLSAAQVLVSRAQSDESLALVGRGSDQTDPVDLKRVLRALAPPSGLLGEVETLASRVGTTAPAQRLANEFGAFAASPSSPALASTLKSDLIAQTNAAQRRFESAAADATSSLTGLSIAIPLLTVAAAVLALIGLRQRLSEYR
jgi:hypothetical protein